MMTRVATSEQINITLSSDKKSIILRKGDKTWMQTLAEARNVIKGIPVNVCLIRHHQQTGGEFKDCRNGLILQQNRTRVNTWVDRKKYSCSASRLRRLLDGGITELKMSEYTGRYGKNRKPDGSA